MSGKFTIKPPTWPRELTFVEFSRLNPHIRNENQLIQLYNQYLNKYLEELRQKKVHFKQSLNNYLLNELINNNFNNTLDDFQDSYDGDASINVSSPGSISTGGPPLTQNAFYTFEGNTRSTSGFTAPPGTTLNDYLELFNPEDYNFEQGFTIAFFAKFNEAATLLNTVDQKFVFGRGASNKSQIRFGIEGNPLVASPFDSLNFNIGVGDTTVSNKTYSLPNSNASGTGNGFSYTISDGAKFNHYALVYKPDNPTDTTTSGSVFFYKNGVETGSFTTRFTPVKNDSLKDNYEGGENFFIGGHNQFAVLAGSVNNFSSVQAPLTISSFRRYNNNISGYYDGMACSVDEFAFFNEVKTDDEVLKIYNNSLNTRDILDSGGKPTDPAFDNLIAYYQFDMTPNDLSGNGLDGIAKVAPSNIGVGNYGREGGDSEVLKEDVTIVVKGNVTLGNKYKKFKPKDSIKVFDLE